MFSRTGENSIFRVMEKLPFIKHDGIKTNAWFQISHYIMSGEMAVELMTDEPDEDGDHCYMVLSHALPGYCLPPNQIFLDSWVDAHVIGWLKENHLGRMLKPVRYNMGSYRIFAFNKNAERYFDYADEEEGGDLDA